MTRIGMLSAAHLHSGAYGPALNELPNVEFVGLYDNDPERGKERAEAWKTRYFADREALLNEGLDGVVITSENIRHKENCLAAAAHRVNVLCEKPIATTAADAEEMIKACRDAGVILMTAFPCRFSPATVRLKEAVDSGSLGKILAIKGTNRGRNPGGWFNDLSLSGGGAVIDHTVHVADLMRWITGAEPKTVFAEIDNSFHHTDFDDTGTMFIRFDNGMFATIDCSWSRPKCYPTWGDVTMEVIGEKGSMYVDLFAQHFRVYSDATGGGVYAPWGDDIDLEMVRAFVNAIETGAPAPITGEDGLAAVKVAFAAYESAKTKAATAC
jgi:predicted dehydrogenase